MGMSEEKDHRLRMTRVYMSCEAYQSTPRMLIVRGVGKSAGD